MGDVRALSSTLSSTDGTAPSIQSSASAMLKMYNASKLAVAEWRNVLQTCSTSQLLPLLYVANEVIQISKRNRGNNYLESFSTVLGESLQLICERDPSVTEKVRRTAKIWGDRRIFSTRFIGELLSGVENFRDGRGGGGGGHHAQKRHSNQHRFSPPHVPQPTVRQEQAVETAQRQPQSSLTNNDNGLNNDNDSIQFDDDHLQNDDDDDDPFSNSGPSKLNVSVDAQALQRDASRGMKRRRSGDPDAASNLHNSNEPATKTTKRKKQKRKSVLTTSSLVGLVDQLSELDAESKSINRILSSITSSELYKSTDEVNEVGDELIDLHGQINTMILDVKKQKKNLWRIAEDKRGVETEFKRYLLWMKAQLSSDEDEIKFCDDLEKKVTLLQLVHGMFVHLIFSFGLLSYISFLLIVMNYCFVSCMFLYLVYFYFSTCVHNLPLFISIAKARKARDDKRIKESIKRQNAEAAAREKAEKEEVKRSLEKMQKQSSITEAKPGMVWNKQLREYQYLDTEESWRD